jgi:hypothetical protein
MKCDATHKDDKWSSIRAHYEGWFEQLNGDAYCPNHIPEWVASWRYQKLHDNDLLDPYCNDDEDEYEY